MVLLYSLQPDMESSTSYGREGDPEEPYESGEPSTLHASNTHVQDHTQDGVSGQRCTSAGSGICTTGGRGGQPTRGYRCTKGLGQTAGAGLPRRDPCTVGSPPGGG